MGARDFEFGVLAVIFVAGLTVLGESFEEFPFRRRSQLLLNGQTVGIHLQVWTLFSGGISVN